MPLYNTSTTAIALDVTPKWLDNLLSHNNIDGIISESQGVARRLPFDTIVTLYLAKELIDALGLTTSPALVTAAKLLAQPSGESALSPGLRISVDRDAIRADVLGRLSRAVEIATSPSRGRPPKR